VSAIQQAQERWRANNASYSTNFGTSGLNVATSGATVTSYTTSGGFYTMTLSGVSGIGYTAIATAVSTSSQNKDTGCTILQSAVTNGAASNTPTSCWSK
jgi:type IV pilus assembly protein PilE